MPLIEVTEAASKRLLAALGEEGKLGTHALRVKVVGGGCSGLSYELGFDDDVRENDMQLEAYGVRVLVDEKSALYVAGSVLDFKDSLMDYGFKIQNPNAQETCGCGNSFGA